MRRFRGTLRLDPPIVLEVLVVLSFPVLAVVVAARLPVRVGEGASVPRTSTPAATVHVRAVPVFVSSTPDASVLADPTAIRVALSASANALMGRGPGQRLVEMAERPNPLRIKAERLGRVESQYPYRYPALDALLDEHLDTPTAPAVNDLAATLVHAGALRVGSDLEQPFPQAASVAFALLDRARSNGACEPQLNLAFLLSAESVPRDDEVATEYGRAAGACPTDPTPLWLLGQFRSLRAEWPSISGPSPPTPEVKAALRTFDELRREFPNSSAGWSGRADAELRIAYRSIEQPFRARVHFRSALDLYRQAEQMDGDPALLTGVARAYAGLGDFDRAVELQRKAIGERSDLAPLQTRLVEYLERAGDFASAAVAADPLVTAARSPEGQGFFPVAMGDRFDPWNSAEDGHGPLSLGADRALPLSVSLGQPGGGVGDALRDISFIPTYHEVFSVTDRDGWCPGWSRKRDRVIAEGFKSLERPTRSFRSVRIDAPFQCGDLTQLAGIAALDAGQLHRAVEIAKHKGVDEEFDETHSRLHDAHQNLWRFAGDMDRARTAAEKWREALPNDPLAFDRAGEIEYLEGRFAAARERFAAAVRLARADVGFPSAAEAEALVKLGAALAALERHDEALDVFAEGAATGSRAMGLIATIPSLPVGQSDDASAAVYHAMAQAGYSALRLGRMRAALEFYEEAVSVGATIYARPIGGDGSVSRQEVAFNNLSIAQARAGELEAAERSARSAVERDPFNPYSLATRGYALARLGRTDSARELLQASVRDFPGTRAAWNDLGVIEARAGRADAAVEALRRAVEVDRHYALGWFNLGVVLEDRGPIHAIAAQGAFGRAARADAAYRGRQHSLTLDDAVVFSDLDLSKPLPARWSFAGTAPSAPVGAVGFGAVLLLGLGAARAVGGQGFGGADRLLQPLAGVLERARASGYLPAAVAVLAVDAVFVIPAALSSRAGPWSLVLTIAGVTLLVALIMRARVLVARRRSLSLQQRAWMPAILLAIATGVVGVAWAPLPVAVTDRQSTAVHWTAPLVAAALAVPLFCLGILYEIPLTRQLAIAALVMSASALTPVRPLDGGAIASGSSAGAATLAFSATGLLLLLGLA